MSNPIERRLASAPRRSSGSHVPIEVTAHAVAGALFALLRWWVDHDSPHTPEEMDEMYHAIRWVHS